MLRDVNKTFKKNLTTIVSGNLLETITGKKHLTINDDVNETFKKDRVIIIDEDLTETIKLNSIVNVLENYTRIVTGI